MPDLAGSRGVTAHGRLDSSFEATPRRARKLMRQFASLPDGPAVENAPGILRSNHYRLAAPLMLLTGLSSTQYFNHSTSYGCSSREMRLPSSMLG